MVAEIVHRLNATLHEKSRLSIATTLNEHGRLSFIELRELLGMTDGNLCVHVRTMEKKGYIDRRKTVKNGKSRTTCRLSEKGKAALQTYVEEMERLVKSVREHS